jgi:hypothetical protein
VVRLGAPDVSVSLISEAKVRSGILGFDHSF